jgi:hypothetical protein
MTVINVKVFLHWRFGARFKKILESMSKRPFLSRHFSERGQNALNPLRRNDMQYTLMFYMSPSEFSARTDPAKKGAFWEAFLPYVEAVKDAGIFKRVLALRRRKAQRQCK